MSSEDGVSRTAGMNETGTDVVNATNPGGESSRKPKLLPWLTYLILGPLMVIATIAFGTVAMIASLFDGHGGVQHRIAQAWASTLLRFSLSPAEVVGPGTLKRDGPAVYAANHLSYMDTPVLFSKLPFQFRIVARSGLWKIPFIG